MDTKEIRISDYDYGLPDGRIAKHPLPGRDGSKLLVYNRGAITCDVFRNIPAHIPPGSLMVFNNTKVIQARIHFRKETGALIEVFLLEPALPSEYEQMFLARGRCEWLCMVGNLKKWKDGRLLRPLSINGHRLTLSAERTGGDGKSHRIRIEWDNPAVVLSEILEAVGELPIPPYLNRATEESDLVNYQTVYSKVKGSVAAPTAGLHFTPEVLAALDRAGISREEVTLHVGAGTFRPVKSEKIAGHEMHAEYICVGRRTIEAIAEHGAAAVAVGTTSVRTLESLYHIGCKVAANPDVSEEGLHVGQWEPYAEGAGALAPGEALQALLAYMDSRGMETLHTSTSIIIAPGYRYKIVKALVTNFHQPRSTLLLLVSAFVKGDWRRIYDYAMGHGFRFLSYGDSSLLIP